MKKNVCSKILNFLIILAVVVTFGCNKTPSEAELSALHQMQEIVFEQVCYSLAGRCNLENPQDYYYPQSINILANHMVYKDGMWMPAIEMYFPEKRTIIECSSFYNPYDETTDWVDDLLIQVEEERIAQELDEMEEELSEGSYDLNEYEKQIEQALEENKESVDFVGKDNQLKISEFDNEIFIPQHNQDSFILIESSGNNVKRNFFDEKYKLLRTETWKINNSNDASLVEQEDYEFHEDEFQPFKKTVRTDSNLTLYKYNDFGLVEHSENFKIVERNIKKKTVKEEVLISVYDWTYTEDDKIASETCLTNYYDEEYKNLEYTFVKKHIYSYNDFSDVLEQEDAEKIPPDFEYYENDILKMKNKYSAELGTYTSQIFFENDFAVKTTYEKYKRVKDVYTEGKKVTRIKEYE